MTRDALIAFLVEGAPHPLCGPLTEWITSSRRFADFAAAHAHKIRKKLRGPRDAESQRDLLLELETAYLLLRERALSVVYEPEQRDLGRSPDFAVHFTTSLMFMVEVTRMRAQASPQTIAFHDRLTDVVCDKLGQLSPQRGNALIVGVDGLSTAPRDVQETMRRIQQRAEQNDPVLLRRHGFRDRADFFSHLRRLSLLLLRDTRLSAESPAVLWESPLAKWPLPAKVRTAIARSHTVA